MANSNSFVQTLAEVQNKTSVESLDHAKNTSEDTSAGDLSLKAGASKRVHFGYPTALHEAFEGELHKVKLLKKTLAEKDRLIDKQLTYIQELEHRLLEEQCQTRILHNRYENELTHSCYLSQTLSKTHEGALSLQNQADESEVLKFALREELHKRTATIKNLEEQNRTLIAALTEITSRLCESEHETSHQIPGKPAEGVSCESLDSHEKPSTQLSQVSTMFQHTPAAITRTTAQPVRSILKRSSTDDSTLTTLITSATAWMRSYIQPTNTRGVYFHKDECHPKPSSPEFKKRVIRQLNLEQLALARNYLVSLQMPDTVERSEQEPQGPPFESRKRKQEKEEREMFSQSPVQRLKMVRMEQYDQR